MYRRVQCSIWDDDKFVELSDDEKLVWFHLFTNSATSPVGLYKASLAGLAEDMRWDPARYRDAVSGLMDAGMVAVDEVARVVWLPKFFKHNRPENPNVLKGWVKSLEFIPSCRFKGELLSMLKQTFAKEWGPQFVAALGNVSQTLPQTLPERQANVTPNVWRKEKEKERERTPPPFPLLKTFPERLPTAQHVELAAQGAYIENQETEPQAHEAGTGDFVPPGTSTPSQPSATDGNRAPEGDNRDRAIPPASARPDPAAKRDQGKAKVDAIPYELIVNELNKAHKLVGSSRSFRHQTKNTRSLIAARWAEGFRLEDFLAVIACKASEWIPGERWGVGSGDWSGRLKIDYVRPETLFSGKFERYLQEARAGGVKKPPSPELIAAQRAHETERKLTELSKCEGSAEQNFELGKQRAAELIRKLKLKGIGGSVK